MRHSKFLDLIVLAVLIAIMLIWWTISELNSKSDLQMKPDAFAYSESELVCGFELTDFKGNIEGTCSQHVIVDNKEGLL